MKKNEKNKDTSKTELNNITNEECFLKMKVKLQTVIYCIFIIYIRCLIMLMTILYNDIGSLQYSSVQYYLFF